MAPISAIRFGASAGRNHFTLVIRAAKLVVRVKASKVTIDSNNILGNVKCCGVQIRFGRGEKGVLLDLICPILVKDVTGPCNLHVFSRPNLYSDQHMNLGLSCRTNLSTTISCEDE